MFSEDAHCPKGSIFLMDCPAAPIGTEECEATTYPSSGSSSGTSGAEVAGLGPEVYQPRSAT